MSILMEEMMKTDEKKWIYENIDYLFEKFFYNATSLSSSNLMKYIKQDSEEEYKKLYPKFIEFMFRYEPYTKKEKDRKIIKLDKNTTMVMGKIIEKIAQKEHLETCDLKWIGSGKYSNVYKLGNIVIKLGEQRLSNNVPKHKNILSPYILEKIKVNDKDKEYLEITKYVEPLKEENFKENKQIVYNIFKNLRQDKIVWIDARAENVGKTDDGKYVILDADAIYSEEYFEKNKKEIQNKVDLGNYEMFEEMRLNELNKENGER